MANFRDFQALEAIPKHSAMNTTAVIYHHSRSAAEELAPKRIRVNAVAPGLMPNHLPASLPETKLQVRLGNIKIGCFGKPGEMAQSMLFLCSATPSYMTGQVLGVHGGMVL
jgi:3-oxoacyl-[acyl-carrier protein] reductase